MAPLWCRRFRGRAQEVPRGVLDAVLFLHTSRSLLRMGYRRFFDGLLWGRFLDLPTNTFPKRREAGRIPQRVHGVEWVNANLLMRVFRW